MLADLTHTDRVLLEQIAKDDHDAFTAIYERYWEPLLISASMAIRHKEDAADIVQEVFMSLWKRRQEINITSSLKAYLDASVRFKAIHYIEKNITRRDYMVLLQEMAAHHEINDIEATLGLKQLKETINRVVGGLPPRMQEVYRLSRHEMLTHREIASRLDISEETVKKHIQHALAEIKNVLGPAIHHLAILLFSYLVK